jgi:hypothetical protein
MRLEARMPRAEGDDSKSNSCGTLAALLFGFRDPRLSQQLEKFRISYEAEFGPTDLTKRYTSTWPADHQDFLIENWPERYWDGLPPFVQAFIKEKMHAARRKGNLDNMPANYLRLYLSGKMKIDEGQSR